MRARCGRCGRDLDDGQGTRACLRCERVLCHGCLCLRFRESYSCDGLPVCLADADSGARLNNAPGDDEAPCEHCGNLVEPGRG